MNLALRKLVLILIYSKGVLLLFINYYTTYSNFNESAYLAPLHSEPRNIRFDCHAYMFKDMKIQDQRVYNAEFTAVDH